MTPAPAPARVGPLGRRAATAPPALDVDALLDDPATAHHRVLRLGRRRQDHDVGGAGAAGRRAGPQGRRAHHRPGPAAGPVDGHREARQRAAAGARASTRPAPASLDAMMLDMKRTFDEVVESQASPEKAAQILANPFYVALSSSFAGTQEYMAMEKLGQLHADARRTGRWDLIVVDTPPSRSALDFLDAPERLSSFLDGRFIRLLLAPGPRPGQADDGRARHGHQRADQDPRRAGAARHADVRRRVRHAVRRVPAARRRRPTQLLQADGTAFLVVAAPEPDALREAAYFVERLNEERMPLAGPGGQPGQPRPRAASCRPSGRCAAAERLDEDEHRRARRPGCCGCTPTGPGIVARESRLRRAVRRPRTRTCRRPSCRPCPPTCTTSTACAGSASCLAQTP